MDSKSDQLLAIKVMRLSRPLLYNPPVVESDPWDLPGKYLEHCVPSDSFDPTENISVENNVILPQGFGTIYLGETFQSYLRVQNTASQVVTNVVVKAELQTAAQRLQLTKKNVPPIDLQPQQSVDEILNHEVTEIGTHILVCEVTYKSATGDPMTSSRYYKFQVQKPLDVKTKFYNAESDDVYLEAQIQNITAGPIFLEKVSLDPSPLFKVLSLNDFPSVGNPPSDSSLFGPVNVVQCGEIRQYLYCLQPRAEARLDSRALRGESNIGKLDLVWRTSLGDRGRLQTSQLQRMAPNYGNIRLTIEKLPNPVELHKPINLVCRITNTSERPVELSLVYETRSKPTALLWTGISNRPLDKIESNCWAEITLNLIPILPGLQSISGLRLVDLFLKRTYDYDDLAQVLVLPRIMQ